MFSWVLKIIPKLDNATLKSMERTLQSRFMRVAKSFGKGLASVLKGGGYVGIALGLVDKLLNPLKDVQEAIDRTLRSSDDVVTNAKQFDTTAGKLQKAIFLAQSTGLDQDTLFQMITKFQAAVAEAKQDPSKPSVVSNFTSNPDTLESFFQMIESLRKMETSQRILAEKDLFGEKNILKMADFVQTDHGLQALKIQLGKVATSTLTKDLNHLGGLNDLDNELMATRNLLDLHKKAGIINEGMVRTRNAAEILDLTRENQNIANYQNLAAISMNMVKVYTLLEDWMKTIGSFMSKTSGFIDLMVKWLSVNSLSKFAGSLFGRGGK